MLTLGLTGRIWICTTPQDGRKSFDGLQAVVCDVDLAEFGEESVRQNLEQLAWVEKVARTHDSVVRAVAARATVAPLRLVTVCLDDDSVVSRLRQWEGPLRAALQRVEGCREWSVKAYAAGTSGESAAESAEVFRVADGRFVGYWCLTNVAGLMRQLTEEVTAATV